MAARWFYEMADGSLTIGYTRFGMIADRHLQRRSSVVALGLGQCSVSAGGEGISPYLPFGRYGLHRAAPMKFQRIEFSWRAAFIGLSMTPERDKLWVTILPFFPLYFKRS